MPNGLRRDATLNLIGLTIPVAVGVVAIPMVVRRMEPAEFAIVAIAWSLLGYASASDLGLGRAIAKLGSETRGDTQVSRLRTLVRRAITVQLVIGCAAALALWLLAPMIARRLHFARDRWSDVVAALRVLSIAIPGVLITNSYRGGLEALGRFDLANLTRMPFSLANYVLPLIALLAGAGVRGIIWLLLLARLLAAATSALLFYRALPPATAPDHTGYRELLHFGGWISVTSIIVPIAGYADRFIVGGIIGAAALGLYAAIYELASKLLIVPGGIANALLPRFSYTSAAGDQARLIRQSARAVRWSAALMAGPVIVLFIFARAFLEFALGPEYTAAAPALRWLVIGVFLNGLAFVPFTLLEGTGHPDLTAKYHLFELPLYLGGTVLLVRSMGLEGAAIAWLLRCAGMWIILAFLAARAVRVPVAAMAGAIGSAAD